MSRGKEFTIDRCKTEVKFRFARRVRFGRNRVFVIVRNGELKFERERERENTGSRSDIGMSTNTESPTGSITNMAFKKRERAELRNDAKIGRVYESQRRVKKIWLSVLHSPRSERA